MLTGTPRYEVESPLPASRAAYAARAIVLTASEIDPSWVKATAEYVTMSCVERVADTDATVLLFGRNGNRQEVGARAPDQHSRRCRIQPFVVVRNCAAMRATLIESELSGGERGASRTPRHSGRGVRGSASRHPVLDEIGRAAGGVRSKLLRVPSRTVTRSSVSAASRSITSDVRIVAATNRDLQEKCT